MTCNNCGHECHCGRVLKKDIDSSDNAIEVCKNCRCKDCDADKKD